MQLGEAAHVRLVHDGAIPRHHAPDALAVPFEVRVDDHRLRPERRAVALVEGGVLLAHLVAESRRGPLQLADVRACVRIEEQLVRIEAMPFLGLVRPVDAKTVDLAGTNAGQVAMPDFAAVLGQLDARHLGLTGWIEQAKLDARSVGGEEREVDAFAVPVGTLGVRQAFAQGVELEFGSVHGERETVRNRRAAPSSRTLGRTAYCVTTSPLAASCRQRLPCAAPR